MAQDRMLQDLNTAYNTEITGYHFYTTAAALVEDPKGRAVFANLAKDELAHIVVVGKIAESLKNGLGWISYEEALAQGFGIALSGQIPFPAENDLLKRLSTNQSDSNAVQIAIDTEMAAVDFYSNLLKTAGTPEEKVCVTKLLEMEKGHLKVLRWEYESLNKTGFWCGEMEYSVEKESEYMYDAIVVGLGPAGSTAARGLAMAGLHVLGIDKETFPRYKSCGGCISTKIERILDFDISPAIEERVKGATYTYKSGRTMDILSDRPVGYNVMRDTFDALLLDKAKEAGAEVIEGVRVVKAADKGASVEVKLADGRTFEAKVLVGADGSSGFIGRELFGLNPKEAAVSITAEVPLPRSARPYSEKLFIDFGSVPYGYGWIFPKKDFLSVGIAGDACKVGGRIKDYWNEFVTTHEALKGLDLGQRVGWTVPVYYDGAAPSVKGNVIVTGDTGHLVDPFLGEGIYYAIRTAKSAASVIIDHIKAGKGLDEYQAWLEKEIHPEFKSAGKLSDLVYNHPRLWYSILEKDPEIMQRFYDVIRGEEDCSVFYNWVMGKVKSKPWKILRRWVESRLLPS